jgi:hypothetical protein
VAASVLRTIKGRDIIANVGTPEELTGALQHAKPGRYVIEESSTAGELLPDGYTCQRLGGAIRQCDGSAMLEPQPSPVKKSPLCHGLARRHLAPLDTQAADPDASLQSGVARFGRIDRSAQRSPGARRSDRPKRRTVAWRASVSSDRSTLNSTGRQSGA